jgi:hypothetical protein
MFNHAMIQISTIDKRELWFELASHAHFFHQPTLRGIYDSFLWAGMAAAGIRPKPSAVIFVEGPAVQ